MMQALVTSLGLYGGTLAHAGGQVLHALAQHSSALAVALYNAPAYDVSVPPLGVARLSINLVQGRVTGGLDGERPQTFLARRHSLFLTPAGAGAAWRKSSASRHINIYFHARAFEHADDASCDPLLAEDGPLLNAGLRGATAMLDMLACELVAKQAFSAEAVDSLARLVLVRLLRQQRYAVQRASPLTPALQARLTDFIQARLDQRLLVHDLAAAVGLPPNRFAAAFVDATGLSPHQYVIQLRLERALQLLRGSTHSLVEIAAACGFASQQHMTQLMRQRLGTTPARQRGPVAPVRRPAEVQ
jgi:AraC-like DNA-binding protein